MSTRISTKHPVVETVSGTRYLMTPTAFVGLDNGYSVLRENFKTVFTTGITFTKLMVQYRKHGIFGGRGENAVEHYRVRIVGGRLHIGCNVFNAAAKRAIVKWALS